MVEAMNFGRPVIASDIQVFREIGNDYPIYFGLQHPSCLTQAILDFEDAGNRHDFTPKNYLTWDESMQNLFQKIISMVNKIRLKQELA